MKEIKPYSDGSACRFKFKNIMQLKQTSFHSKVVKREKRKSEGEIYMPAGLFLPARSTDLPHKPLVGARCPVIS